MAFLKAAFQANPGSEKKLLGQINNFKTFF